MPAPHPSARARLNSHDDACHLPGLNGRSVRQLRYLQAVRFLQRALVLSATAGVVFVVASVGLPAYAEASAAAEVPQVQLLTVADSVRVLPVERDGYSVTPPPPIQWPTGPDTRIAGGFGARVAPCDGCSSYHLGVDFDAGWGADVHAMAAGVVTETKSPFLTAYGNHVTIQHEIDGQTVTTLYAHMQYGSTSLSVGDSVKVGQVLGRVGSTGASTGPHLHFEIRVAGSSVDPLVWLRTHIK